LLCLELAYECQFVFGKSLHARSVASAIYETQH
jgi:hypothetical protein